MINKLIKVKIFFQSAKNLESHLTKNLLSFFKIIKEYTTKVHYNDYILIELARNVS